MADQKISVLPEAVLPLVGDESVPVVQGGVTVRAPSSALKGLKGDKGDPGDQGLPGDPGADGADGRGIASIARTSGTGAAGTTDTYTITFTDATTTTFTVYNGADGSGTSGDFVPLAGNVTMAGPLSVPAGASGAQVPQAQETYGPKNGQLAGMRNKIINGNFSINQRGYVSGAATTAGQYTLDRWKVTGTGGITFSTTNNKTTVTIPSGQTIQQVIEGLNLQTGTYVLSWEGTAQGRIAGGSYGASGLVTASIAGGANTTIEFNAGTVANVQLELGTIATPFEHRPYGAELALCQRYHEVFQYSTGGQGSGAGVTIEAEWFAFKVTKRAAPTVSRGGGSFTNVAVVTLDHATVNGCRATFQTSVAGGWGGVNDTLTAAIEL